MVALKGGDKLVAALQRISDKVSKAATVDIGFLENASYPDGTPVAMVAAINEFGAPSRGQPPRPFFRNMIAAKSPAWPETVGKLLKASDFDGARTLRLMGEGISGQLRDSIINFAGAPLKPSTVAAKGFSSPLIDTSVMLNSIDFKVSD